MTTGSINRAGQPMLPVAVQSPARQQFITFNFIMDTGFNGDLQLPAADIGRLGLAPIETVDTELADGQVVEADVYPATALWLGTSTAVNIIESENNIPLVGAGLFWGSAMIVEWEFGGRVSIEPIPRPEPEAE